MKFGTLTAKAKNFLGQYEQKDPATYAAAQQAIGGLLILDGFIGIDNPFAGKKRPGIFGTLTGVVLGVVFMFVPAFFGNVSGADTMTATTNAVVVSSSVDSAASSSTSNTCSLTVHYTVASKEYTQRSSINSSDNCSLTAGQTVPINYNPQNPATWAYNLNALKTVFSLFFWIGLVVAITSFVTFIIRLLSIIFGWKLLKNGRVLAKTLPQGASIGTLIEEIKQNFTGMVFNRSAVAIPSVTSTPFIQPAQVPIQAAPQMQPVTTAPIVAQPVAPMTPPQATGPDNYPPATPPPAQPPLS